MLDRIHRGRNNIVKVRNRIVRITWAAELEIHWIVRLVQRGQNTVQT